MKKKNGFVFMETIIVISVLSLTMLLLFASYSYLLRKSRTKKMYDVTDTIYKTYYFNQLVGSLSTSTSAYIKSNCTNIGSNQYLCDISNITSGNLYQIKTVYDIDKYYLINPKTILTASNSATLLNKLDATTIDYIKSIGVGVDTNLLIVKFKKVYSDGTYEVYHASMEVS